MKSIYCLVLFFLSSVSLAQDPQVVVFKHELRWADESRFPNYFLIPELRDSVFYSTKNELMKYLGVSDILFPGSVDYKIIPGFGKQKTEMPKSSGAGNPEIGIFSFITRATTGYAMFWKFKIIIKQDKKIILDKEVSHELEYFNSSGYLTSQLWMSQFEFQDIFKRLVKETLGFLPESGDKIILGSLEPIEKKVRSYSPLFRRNILKINGGWRTSGNYSALIESEKDTLMKFDFMYGIPWEISGPSLGSFLSSLFTEVTGIDVLYDQKVINQIKGTLSFSDGQKFGIILKWIEYATTSSKNQDIVSTISDPFVAEIYDNRQQAGYFVYNLEEKVRATDKTTEKFNAFTGFQTENSLGIERIHRIRGSLAGMPVLAEYNENEGIITINYDNELLCAMVVYNISPENTSVGNQKMSDNKVFIGSASQSITKPSLDNEKKVEWYPVYFKESSNDDSRRKCIEILICLFFGMGNMY